jgi:hypothetical protein
MAGAMSQASVAGRSTGEGLYPRERWLWFERLWSDACALQKRYRLLPRSEWWADEVRVETLAALAA